MNPYAAHIRELADELGAEEIVPVSTWFEAASNSASRILYLPEIDGLIPYWVAMHELGHLATIPASTPWYHRADVLEREVDAWEWAFTNSKLPVDGAAKAVVFGGLVTHRNEDIFAPSSDRADSMIEWAQDGLDWGVLNAIEDEARSLGFATAA